MSHTALTYHLIFGTHNRHRVIPQDHERELYKFMYDFANSREVYIRRIGGMPDHVHILCDIPAKVAIADFVRLIKTESSKFMRANPQFPDWWKWAEGYGDFTVDASSREARRQYIIRQREHHQRINFRGEYRDFLREAGFPDDAFILGDEDV